MITGPEIAPDRGIAAKHLMVMLHGIGASGQDLIGLAGQFKKHFYDMHFVAPDAPFPYSGAPSGHQWFSLQDTSTTKLLEGLSTAAPYLNEFIDFQLDALGLKDDQLIVLGFSQGTMIALHTLLRRPKPAALLLGFSGMMVAPEACAVRSRPVVALLHGDQDRVVPLECMLRTYKALKKLGVDVSEHVFAGLGHSISQGGIHSAIAAIKKACRHSND